MESQPASKLFFLMRRLFTGALGLLLLAGCEQQRPPTPEGRRLIESRTAVGTRNTRLEARPQPFPVKTGLSIWDLKVFASKDNPNGTRKEWKFFESLPQTNRSLNTTQTLMRAWVISRDGRIFLPRIPAYKAYGSFVTDWNITHPGSYTLFVEYQPLQKAEEGIRQGEAIPRELARWNFEVRDSASTAQIGGALPAPARAVRASTRTSAPFYKADEPAVGTSAPFEAAISVPTLRRGKEALLNWSAPTNTPGEAAQNSAPTRTGTTFLSPDRTVLQHFPTHEVRWQPAQSGMWKVWLSVEREGQTWIAPIEVSVK